MGERSRPLPRAWLAARGVEARAWDRWNARVDRRVSLLAPTLLMLYGAGLASSRVHVRQAFYAVLAQVLPVLMLAVVVEGRYFRNIGHREPLDRFLLRGLLLLPALGELSALIVLAEGHDTLWLRGSCLLALGTAVLMLFVYAVDGPATGRSTRASLLRDAVDQVRSAHQARSAPDREGVG